MKKTLSLMLVLSLLIAMLSGCSTSKQPESTVEPTSAPEPTAIAAPEEAAMSADIVVVGSGLARIRNRG